MNDFKFTTVVSIYPDGVKVMAGYVMNNMPYVANAVDVGCSGLVVDGQLVDQNRAVEAIQKAVGELAKNMNQNINNVALLLPCEGCTLINDKKGTYISNVTCNYTDVKNCVNIFGNSLSYDKDAYSIDIVPLFYQYASSQNEEEDKKTYFDFHLGKTCRLLSITSAGILMKRSTYDQFIDVVRKAGFDISFKNISTYASAFYYYKKMVNFSTKNRLSNLVYVYLENSFTGFAFLKNGFITKVIDIPYGIQNVVNKISSDLKISKAKADDLLQSIGVDPTIPIPMKIENGFSQIEFIEEAKNGLKELFDKIDKVIKNECANNGSYVAPNVMLLSGSGSLINGIVDYSESTLGIKTADLPVNLIGAHLRTYTDLAGGLLLADRHTYLGSNDSMTRVLARDPVNGSKS